MKIKKVKQIITIYEMEKKIIFGNIDVEKHKFNQCKNPISIYGFNIDRLVSEPIYNEKYLKIEIKSYKGKFNTNFHKDKIPKEFHCLSANFIVFKLDKNYDP